MAFELQACLFDLDGVIVDTAKYHFTAWQRLAEELGVPFDHADNDQLKGVSRVESLEYILRKGSLELDNDTKVRLMDRKNDWYLAQVEAMQPDELFPGVVAFIDELRAAGVGVALGSSRNALISTAASRTVRCHHRRQQHHLFQARPGLPEGSGGPRSEPARTVVFEDAVSGVQAALNGGFRVVGIGDAETLTKRTSSSTADGLRCKLVDRLS